MRNPGFDVGRNPGKACGPGRGERRIDKVVSEVLSRIRVVDPVLQDVVKRACREFWGSVEEEEVLVGGFRAGTLTLLLESHARVAEAKNFVGEKIRLRINELLKKEEGGSPGEPGSGASFYGEPRQEAPGQRSRSLQEGSYVARIHFYLRGTK